MKETNIIVHVVILNLHSVHFRKDVVKRSSPYRSSYIGVDVHVLYNSYV